jgi:hypothetical protein
MPTPTEFLEIRRAIASLPADVSNDAIGAHAPRLDEISGPPSSWVHVAPEKASGPVF